MQFKNPITIVHAMAGTNLNFAQVKSMDDNCGEWEWVKSMGVATGCGCKEVYRFPHTTYPYSSCICSFCSSIPTFCSFFCFSFLYYVLLILYIVS